MRLESRKDGEITRDMGVVGSSRCVSRLPACIFVVTVVTGWGKGERCLEQTKEWSQRCVSKSRSLGGKLTHKNIFGFGQTHVQGENLNSTQIRQLLHKGVKTPLCMKGGKTDSQFNEQCNIYLDFDKFG